MLYTKTRPYDIAIISCLLLSSIPIASCRPPPGSLLPRQTTFDDLALPKCSLSCFINSLTSDGCANETDFKCHCEKGTMLSAADPCLRSRCSKDEQVDAMNKIRTACRATGIDLGNGDKDGQNSITRSISMSEPTRTTGPTTQDTNPTASISSSTNTQTPNPAPGNPANGPTQLPPPSAPTDIPTQSNPDNTSSPTDPPPMPTDTPLALLPTDRQLSPGAKAGIGVSVSLLFTSLLITLILYIRRLKRELRAAQAQAAGVPESVWRAHISTASTPGIMPRRRSSSWRDRGRSPPESPVSPLSETGGGPALLKKKRGHVLSVVVEREEEGSEAASLEPMVPREPVPGQSEGLVDPLELDGEYTGIVELPTSVTPRARSLERAGRERGSSFGDSSRPSTRGSAEKTRFVV
ncbi:hypothetical protein BU24DRAFT_241830 [Aaosphaeria arxii CBS 175.79]|uniref:CFEM domain-containing protein n=1 Tax=Aaosphaeria arxii CBS 175.79 TaxID=1450172 RepID=A0A6A5XMR2_9PLEO|nr:uncharacterized protein BU24DRAFT_241830 [Aaosphaeria arxii CBS 175.79]KAF2013624.1 hypothetical protein BU24DRAFT_241830 [Aaosphaeria arxii CBS 175.79]